MNPKSNQRVLVTGASRGIGRATMRYLASSGYDVVGLARTRPSDATADERFVCCDLMDLESTRQVLDGLAREAPFYGLVNNAALAHTINIAQTSVADMNEAMTVNVNAALVCLQSLMPGMVAAGIGRVVNISSRAALGKPNRTAYSASKAAVIGMSRTWALELAGSNVTVNVIAPGPVATELFKQASPPESAQTKALLAAVPLQRVSEPQEIAHAIAFLLHPLSGYITGQTLHIDGGLTISATRL
ncbi:SDR family oxidoreductase [Diaphorobacter sp. HDW4A]|uniref:SDR family oxidoreductase n=1 Tax=Diaphorobacter sp. HDW4A TaxID=2714924 RepID=UPI00140E522D|nr:SDR family oxidoreductase [Diaphorobacter sp. HDW4A]QIL80975.1 SDR family oxidoreductase [Diaphorobacter sp. HDW4A]